MLFSFYNPNDIIEINVEIFGVLSERMKNMLKLPLLELFARGIPEAFLFILAAYVFSKSMFNIKKYFLSSMLYAALVYLIRFLPIQYGVNTILTVIVLIAVNTFINNLDIVKSIQIGIISIILEFICEGINVFIIQYVFKANINYVFNNPDLKVLYGIPSLFIFGCIIIIYYIAIKKGKELKRIKED